MKNLKCWRRLIALAVSAALAAPIPAVSAAGEDTGIQLEEAAEDGFVIKFIKNQYVLTEYTGTDPVVEIPEGVGSVGQSAFEGCATLVGVTVPESVGFIEVEAFSGCTALKDVMMEEGVCGICDEAFAGCTALENVTLPKTLSAIYPRAFADCSSLEKIVIPESPYGHTLEMESQAFENCSSLKEITILRENVQINGAFSHCNALEGIVIPSGTRLGYGSFWECTALKKVIFQEPAWGSIGPYAFQGCSKLEDIYIPEGIKEIEWGAFENCSSLKGIVVPKSVVKIEEFAFQGCNQLENVDIQNETAEIGGNAFDGTKWQESQRDPNGLLIRNNIVVDGKKAAGTVVIPEGVTGIGERAFENCAGLKEIVIPRGVKNIGSYAFGGCTALESATIPEGLEGFGYSSFEGCSALKSMIIPEGITKLENCQFKGCSALENVTIPKTVEEIGNFVFQDCGALEDIIIPGSVKKIGESAFSNCNILECIKIPDGVITIDWGAFGGCAALESITIPKSVANIGNGAFSGCAGLTIYGEVGSYAQTYAEENKIPFSEEEMPPASGKIKLSDCEVTIDPLVCIYTGNWPPLRPEVTIRYKGITLNRETDYYLDYWDDCEVGTGRIVITARENYKGVLEKNYTIIAQRELSGCEIALGEDSYVYDGAEKRPEAIVKDGEVLLQEGIDYTAEYFNNTNAGTGELYLTGLGRYCGVVREAFPIQPRQISGPNVSISESSYVYDGTEKKPAILVKMEGATLEEGTDYTVSYQNNISIGEASAVITGIGNYQGEVRKPFAIAGPSSPTRPEEGPPSGGDAPSLPKDEGPSDENSSGGGSPSLPKNEDSSNGSQSTPAENGKPSGGGAMPPAVQPSVSAEKNNPILGYTKVYSKTYGNKPFPLKLKLAKGHGTLTYTSFNRRVAAVDQKGNVSLKGAGAAVVSVKAEATGSCKKAEVRVTIKVRPARQKIKSLKLQKSGKLKVSWKRDKQATGYQIQYSTDKRFKNKKNTRTILIKKKGTSSKVIPKLKNGKRYYVRVRAYKTAKINGKNQKLYGAWSNKKRSRIVGKI